MEGEKDTADTEKSSGETKNSPQQSPYDPRSHVYVDFSKTSYEDVKVIFKPKATQVRFP